MSIVLLAGAVAVILGLLFLGVRPMRHDQPGAPHLEAIEEPARQHATYFRVIRQAMSEEDLAFLATRGPLGLVRRAHKERQRIALLYLRFARRFREVAASGSSNCGAFSGGPSVARV